MRPSRSKDQPRYGAALLGISMQGEGSTPEREETGHDRVLALGGLAYAGNSPPATEITASLTIGNLRAERPVADRALLEDLSGAAPRRAADGAAEAVVEEGHDLQVFVGVDPWQWPVCRPFADGVHRFFVKGPIA